MGNPEVPAPLASALVMFERDLAQSGRRLGT
jgi:hypothetical protein